MAIPYQSGVSTAISAAVKLTEPVPPTFITFNEIDVVPEAGYPRTLVITRLDVPNALKEQELPISPTVNGSPEIERSPDNVPLSEISTLNLAHTTFPILVYEPDCIEYEATLPLAAVTVGVQVPSS